MSEAQRRAAQARRDAAEPGELVVCRECGESFFQLQSHVRAIHHMTIEEYRAEWSLPEHQGVWGERSKREYAERMADIHREHPDQAQAALERAHKAAHTAANRERLAALSAAALAVKMQRNAERRHAAAQAAGWSDFRSAVDATTTLGLAEVGRRLGMTKQAVRYWQQKFRAIDDEKISDLTH